MNSILNFNKEVSQRAAHEVVREEMLLLQKSGGSAIKPLSLYRVFLEIIKEIDPEETRPLVWARYVSDTFCALANEFYVINAFSKNPQEDFYLSEDRWEKYYLGGGRDKALDYLEQMDLVARIVNEDPKDLTQNYTTYKINVALLTALRKDVEAYVASNPKTKRTH